MRHKARQRNEAGPTFRILTGFDNIRRDRGPIVVAFCGKDQRIHSASWQARQLAPSLRRGKADEALGIVQGEVRVWCLHGFD